MVLRLIKIESNEIRNIYFIALSFPSLKNVISSYVLLEEMLASVCRGLEAHP